MIQWKGPRHFTCPRLYSGAGEGLTTQEGWLFIFSLISTSKGRNSSVLPQRKFNVVILLVESYCLSLRSEERR